MTTVTPDTFDPANFARKLNLGCGFDHREGYVNIDMNSWHNPDVLADVRKIGFLPSKYYDEIVAQDVLEHLPRTQTLRTLAHWNRPLRMGGKIVLRLPSVLGIADLLGRRENQSLARRESLIQCLFGTPAAYRRFPLHIVHANTHRGISESGGLPHAADGIDRRLAVRRDGREGRAHRGPAGARLQRVARRAGRRRGVREPGATARYWGAIPTSGGANYFLGVLRSDGMTRQAVIDIMIGSPEYHDLRHRGLQNSDSVSGLGRRRCTPGRPMSFLEPCIVSARIALIFDSGPAGEVALAYYIGRRSKLPRTTMVPALLRCRTSEHGYRQEANG
ncbi:MAG: hypothetical protein MZW92_20235 [Comamonadaceae bacterium]|nr:hypothetical protein [Comamonadaceae bacterium]